MTSARPTPKGKATERPASEVEAESRMLDRLNTTPPMMADSIPAEVTCMRSGTKLRPCSPMLPSVNPMTRENKRMPIT